MAGCMRRLLLAAGLLLGLGQAALADVIFSFQQIGPTMQTPYAGIGEPFPTPILASLEFVVEDDAFASGLDLRQRNGNSGPPYAFLDGLVQVHIGAQNLPEAFNASLDEFTRDIPIMGAGFSSISLGSAPKGLPIGSIILSTVQYLTVEFHFDGTAGVSGRIIGDGSCFWGCRFGGEVTVSVPEPASILTFGMGLLGLGAALRRRRGSSASGSSTGIRCSGP